MHLQLNEEQQFIQDTARRFSARRTAARCRNSSILARAANCCWAILKSSPSWVLWDSISHADYGGTEAGSVAFSVALTELGRGCASTAVTVSVTNMVAEVIQACGSDQQKQITCLNSARENIPLPVFV